MHPVPLPEVREMRKRLLGPLMPYLREALKHGKRYQAKAASIVADYAMGLISRDEAEQRLKALLAEAKRAERRRGKAGIRRSQARGQRRSPRRIT